jgi:hypothetical protein
VIVNVDLKRGDGEDEGFIHGIHLSMAEMEKKIRDDNALN